MVQINSGFPQPAPIVFIAEVGAEADPEHAADLARHKDDRRLADDADDEDEVLRLTRLIMDLKGQGSRTPGSGAFLATPGSTTGPARRAQSARGPGQSPAANR